MEKSKQDTLKFLMQEGAVQVLPSDGLYKQVVKWLTQIKCLKIKHYYKGGKTREERIWISRASENQGRKVESMEWDARDDKPFNSRQVCQNKGTYVLFLLSTWDFQVYLNSHKSIIYVSIFIMK